LYRPNRPVRAPVRRPAQIIPGAMKSIAVSTRHSPRVFSPRICRRRDLAVPHESLWGRWNKLELFNRASGPEIQKYLRDPKAARELSWDRSAEPGDSRVAGILDARKLTELSAPGFEPTVGVIADYIPIAEKSRVYRDLWSARILRFCPQCIKSGVHVTYFQLHFVGRCPVHGVELQTCCPACRRPIEYLHGQIGGCSRFRCSCDRHLWNWESKPRCSVSALLKQRHAEAGDWIRAATRRGEMLHYPWKHESRNDGSEKKNARLQSFATLIARAYPELGRLPSNFNNKVANRIVTSRVNGSAGLCAAPERLRLVAVYKSICRHYRLRLLRHHRAAIGEVYLTKGWPLCGNYGEVCLAAPFAPAASAFIAWRMYWEGVNSPHELNRPRGQYVPMENVNRGPLHWTITLEDRFFDLVSSPEWKREECLSREIRLRWFAEVCMRVFDECLLIVTHQFQEKHRIDGRHHWRVTTAWITGRMIPFMLPRCERDRSATLFWLRKYQRAADTPSLARSIAKPPSKAEFQTYRDAERRRLDWVTGLLHIRTRNTRACTMGEGRTESDLKSKRGRAQRRHG
jgi:hypothetical protein